MTRFPGYTPVEQIFIGSRSRIVRAVRDIDGVRVVLKVPVSDQLPLRDLLRFEHEYRVLESLDLKHVIKVHALVPHGAGFLVVEEDFGAQDLAHFLSEKSLCPNDFYPIAQAMAEGLAELHANLVLHKDLHPGNVLIEPLSGLVKLTDFGLSTLIEDETPDTLAAEMIEGSLAYISPEQTGRMNYPVDSRSDLYALGVCYYRMLTGQLPFAATDALEMMHAHIAKQPVEPRAVASGVSQELSALVMKLLAKEPRQRYQSARGVVADLQALAAASRLGGVVADFVPGAKDVSTRFQVSRTLYGRESQVAQLLSAFDRVALGRTELLLVAGYSGVGKTALVQEVHRSLAHCKGRFLSGKHDQFRRDFPFSALIQAFGQLMRHILAERDERVALWRKALLEELGSNARILVDVLPEAAILLGPQEAAPELGPVETKNRFVLTLQRFLGVFARSQHPLVVFVDDLQWADNASLQLMRALCRDTAGQCLLLIGAYRDNEVSATHPLMDLVRQLEQDAGSVQTITLKPLGTRDTNLLLVDTMGQTELACRPLSDLLYQKTGGNPFFLTQMLKELHTKGVFRQHPVSGQWTAQLDRVQALEITDNVVDLMVVRLTRLAPVTQELLKTAACVGSRFSIDTLATVVGRPEADVANDLWDALNQSLVRTLGEQFSFLHDRVQQAAYSLLSVIERKQLHLRLGRLLVDRLGADPLENALFDIVGHFNQALSEVTQPFEKARVLGLNVRAGKKALRSTASTAALSFFQTALCFLPPNSWESDYPLTLDVYTGAVGAAFFCGDFALMNTYSGVVLEQAKTELDKVPVFTAKHDVCVSQARNLDGIMTVLPVLRQLGVCFPDSPTGDDIQTALGQTAARLAQRPIEALLDLPLMTDPQKIAALKILVSISSSSYQSFPALFPLVVLKQVEISLDYGNCEWSAFGYTTYAMVLSGLMQDFDAAYQLGQMAIDLAQRLQAKKIYGRILFLFNNNIRHHKVALKETLADLTESTALTMDLGDPEYSCLASLSYLQHAFFVGQPLGKVQAEMAFSAGVMQGVKQEIALKFTHIYQQTVLNLSADTGNDTPWILRGTAFDVTQPIPANEITTFYCLHSCQGMLEYWFAHYDKAEHSMQAAIAALPGAIGLAGVPPVYFYDCMAKLAVLALRKGQVQQRLLAGLETSFAQLQRSADFCPVNHSHRVLLVQAERLRLTEASWAVLDLYDQAIEQAHCNGYLQEEGLAHERAAEFALALGKQTIGRAYLVQAYRIYGRWGARAKVRALERAYPFLSHPDTMTETTVGYEVTPEKLDLISVLKAAEVLSGEIQLDSLLKKTMAIFIENAGAQEGLLLLPDGNNWIIAAQASLHDKTARLEKIPLAESTLVCEALVRLVMRTRQAVFLDDASQDATFRTDPQVLARGIRSVLCLPLVSHDRLSGILYLENRLTAGAFSVGRSQVLKMLTAQVSIAIENALLYQSLEFKVAERTRDLEAANRQLQALSATDGLTGIANRRKFDATLLAEWRRSGRSQHPVGLIILYVDWFKKFNDHYGHLAGDGCLRKVAEVMSTRARREGDLAARYGGEEFAFIAPNTSIEVLMGLAQEIRQGLEALQIAHIGSAFGIVTASLGIAVMTPGAAEEPTQLIKAADEALYSAKSGGRNRVGGVS